MLNMKKVKYAILLLFVVSAIFALSALLIKRDYKEQIFANPVSFYDTIRVVSGNNSRTIRKLLSEQGVIEDKGLMSYYLDIYLRIHQPMVRMGVYLFEGSYTIDEIFTKFATGSNFYIRVTIPEGTRSEIIASTFQRELGLDSALFMDEVLSPESVEKYGVFSEAKNLRGFLMPDTYKFQPFHTKEDVIRILTSQFMEFWGTIDKALIENSPISPYEVIILASIVETEAIVDRERRKIAGVFHNRLRIDMPLQADPTVRFATGNFDRPIRMSQLRYESPFNTYTTRGLMPTPIANPGRESIIATLTPEKHKYLFFVAKEDGSREHYFSRTNAEHNRFRSVVRQRREERRVE